MRMGYLPREKDGLLRCFLCGEYKPPEEFYNDRTKPYGKYSACKACTGAYQRDYQKRYYQLHKGAKRCV